MKIVQTTRRFSRGRAACVLLVAALAACGDETPATSLADASDAAEDVAERDSDATEDAAQDPAEGEGDPALDVAPDLPPDVAPDVPEGPLPELALNEVQCRGDEWIELINRSDFVARLDGWALSDRAEDPEHHHPLEGELAPGGFLVVRADGDGAPGFTFRLDCGNEQVALIAPGGAVHEQVALSDALPDDATLSRLPDGDGAWDAGAPTPGAPNAPRRDPRDDLFDPALVHTVDIELDDINTQLLGAFPQEYAQASMRFTHADGTVEGPQLVGVRIKGRYGSFRTLDGKSALKVRFNWPGAEASTFRGLRRLTLNNMVQDPSTLHEWTAYAIFRALGVPAPRVGYTRVRLNGQDFGLYANIETVDAIALADDLPGTSHLYEGSYGQDLTWGHLYELENDEGEEVDRRDLRDLIALVEGADDASFFDALATKLDWDAVLNMMAAEVFIGHWDGYAPSANNYYVHFDDLGVARLLPWGTDQTFDAWLGVYDGRGALFARCMRSVPCRAAYDRAFARVVTAVRDLDLPAGILDLGARLRPFNAADPRREYDLDTIDYFQARTIDFILQRLEATAQHVECIERAEDPDGDGFICEQDCGPDDPDTFPGADDTCGDRIDQDCNGWTDDGPDCPDCVPLTSEAGRRYWICPRERTYDEARAQCASLDADVDLAIIDSIEENNALWDEAQRTRRQLYWFGLDDQASENMFMWIDGSLPDVFNAWAPGEPNDAGGNEDCAHFWESEPTWNDIPCDVRMGAICEER